MLLRLLALSLFLLVLMVAASASAQLGCEERPRTTVEYVGFRVEGISPEEREALEMAVGALIARFNLRCGWRLVLTVSGRSGRFEVRPNATELDGGCEWELRIRAGGSRRGGRGTDLASAVEDVATNGASRPSRRECSEADRP